MCVCCSTYDTFRSRVIFLVPVFCLKAEGDVSLGFGAGVAGLGFVLPRGPGSGEGAVAHKGSPPLLSGAELGGWSRGAWLLAPWARWRRRRVGGVGGRWAIDDLGPDVAGVLWCTYRFSAGRPWGQARSREKRPAGTRSPFWVALGASQVHQDNQVRSFPLECLMMPTGAVAAKSNFASIQGGRVVCLPCCPGQYTALRSKQIKAEAICPPPF